jgi:hypothetical protein
MNKQQNNLLKKIMRAVTLSAVCAMILLSQFFISPNKVNAQDAYSPSGTGQEVVCRGDRNWAAYGVTIWNQFMDPRDFGEYWNDLIYRYAENFCHYEDIYSLLKRSDKAAEQVRKAFYSCTSTDKVVKSYYRIEAEIYFLRHYIDYGDKTAEDGTKTPTYFIKPNDSDWQDFNDNLFNSRAEIDALYTEYYSKYNGRMDTYNKCKDPGIENLIVRFNDDMDFLSKTVKSAAKSVSQKAGRLKDTASGLVNAVKSGDYFKGLLQAGINGMPCPILSAALAKAANDSSAAAKTAVDTAHNKLIAAQKDPKKECAMAIQDIKAAINANLPNWQGVNFYDLQNAAENVAKQVKDIRDDTDVMAKYEFLYYESSDNIVGEFVGRMKSLNNIIGGSENSPKYLNQTINCVRGIEKSQCTNISAGG